MGPSGFQPPSHRFMRLEWPFFPRFTEELVIEILPQPSVFLEVNDDSLFPASFIRHEVESAHEAKIPLSSRRTRLHIKAKLKHVAVLDGVFLALNAEPSRLASLGEGAELDEFLVGRAFRRDEAALEVGVNDARRRGGFVARVDRPGARFLF